MRNYHQVTDHWVGNVIRGEKHRERYEGDVFWFRGNILFKHNMGIMRLEKTVDDDWVALRHVNHWGVVFKDRDHTSGWIKRGNPIPTLVLQNIGVFWSHTAKGTLQGRDLHMFVHRQQMANGEDLVDWAHRIGIQRMARYGMATLMSMAHAVIQEHDQYRRRLCPDLPGIPNYAEYVEAVCSKRLAEYNEPERVRQRERNAARRLAKKALGL